MFRKADDADGADFCDFLTFLWRFLILQNDNFGDCVCRQRLVLPDGSGVYKNANGFSNSPDGAFV